MLKHAENDEVCIFCRERVATVIIVGNDCPTCGSEIALCPSCFGALTQEMLAWPSERREIA